MAHKTETREAITLAPLTIGPWQLPRVVPAGTTVTYVVPSDPNSELVYIRHGHYAGAVYRRYLKDA